MEETFHKGFTIRAEPWQLVDNQEWMVRVCIERHFGAGMREQTFTAANSYKTRETAVEHCLNFGRQIVDDKYQRLCVDRL